MLKTAIEIIGKENLEEVAISWHKPIQAVYIIVNKDRTYKTYDEKRIKFNSKLCGMDYYSEVVNYNKSVASKNILSCNIYSFFCKNVQKLKEEDIDKYYKMLNLPDGLIWYKDFVKNNIYELSNKYKQQIKIFFPATREEYRNAGLRNWYDKSISITKLNKELGVPLAYTFNSKKSYLSNTFNTYLIDNTEGLERKVFLDILKGMYKHGYDMLYVDTHKNKLYPANAFEFVNTNILSGYLLCYKLDKFGNIAFNHMDCVVGYTPFITKPYVNKIKSIRKSLGISRAELSRLSKVPLRTLENWEYGERKPSDLDALKRIADALNVEIKDL